VEDGLIIMPKSASFMFIVPRKDLVSQTIVSLVQSLGNGIHYIVLLWHGEDSQS
jgi:hypothetical protein